MTIKDAENEWLNQQKSKKGDIFDLAEANMNSDGGEGYDHHKNGNGIDSGFSSSTNKSDNSDYIETKPFNETSNSNTDLQKTSSANNLNYQNYLQQFQTHSLNSNNNKINAKLKIVSMRNNNSAQNGAANFTHSKSLSNSNMPGNNSNSLSSSSSSSILSNEKENEFKDAKNTSNDDYYYMQPNYIQRGPASNSNSRSNSATGFVRTNQLVKQASSTSSSNNKTATNPNNINTAAAMPTTSNSSVQQADLANIKRSIALNGGSNVHEENIMFFYGIKSLEILDLKIDPAIISQVFTISFHYIDYDEHLSRNFAKIRTKFTNVTVRFSFFAFYKMSMSHFTKFHFPDSIEKKCRKNNINTF